MDALVLISKGMSDEDLDFFMQYNEEHKGMEFGVIFNY